MHTSGKVLAWFVVLLGCGAVVLTGKALAIRTAWMEKAQKYEADYARNAVQLDERVVKLQQIRNELERQMLGWDRYWANIPGGVLDPVKGQIQLDLGTNRGLQDKQVVYVFVQNPDGTSTYAGNFRVSTVQPARAALDAVWRVRPGDLGAIPQGRWRVRTMIPTPDQTRFTDLEVQLLVADEQLAASHRGLELQVALGKVAEQHSDFRFKEVNGDPALAANEVPPEIKAGLLATMAEVEESRNTALAEVDHLRRELKTTNEEFNRILGLNQELTESLPQPAATEPVKVTHR